MISALIFDLGGVILDIDQERTLRAFGRMGADLDTINLGSSVFNDFETGKLTEADFIQFLHSSLKGAFETSHIEEAWNTMLLHVLPERLKMIAALRSRYRIFLLSNTNSIHIRWFTSYLRDQQLHEDWTRLFDRIFLSYEIGLRKPDPACYTYVAEQTGFTPGRCLFIDDSNTNISGAKEAGMHTFTAHRPIDAGLIEEIKEAIRQLR